MFSWITNSSKSYSTPSYTFSGLTNTYNQLQNFKELTDIQLIEALRHLSEILVYGDQNVGAEAFFEYFCEKNILLLFVDIVRNTKSVKVHEQMFQTLSILVQNISSETSLYYLLSNDHINNLISEPYNFSVEELRDWFVTFLKALSLRLNTNTLQFFFNTNSPSHSAFPLYHEALKFSESNESMVRIAIRTLTLSIYQVDDVCMHEYVTNEENIFYFIQKINQLIDISLKMQISLDNQDSVSKLSEFLNEFLDQLDYLQDIFNIQNTIVNKKLLNLLKEHFLQSFLLKSLLATCNMKGKRISTLLSLFLLTEIFRNCTYQPFLSSILCLLFSEDFPNNFYVFHSTLNCKEDDKNCYYVGRYEYGEWLNDEIQNLDGKILKKSLFLLLKSRNDFFSFHTIVFLCSIINNKYIDKSLLKKIQLLPKRLENQRLMEKELEQEKQELERNDKQELEQNDKEQELEQNDKQELEQNDKQEQEQNDKQEQEQNDRQEQEQNDRQEQEQNHFQEKNKLSKELINTEIKEKECYLDSNDEEEEESSPFLCPLLQILARQPSPPFILILSAIKLLVDLVVDQDFSIDIDLSINKEKKRKFLLLSEQKVFEAAHRVIATSLIELMNGSLGNHLFLNLFEDGWKLLPSTDFPISIKEITSKPSFLLDIGNKEQRNDQVERATTCVQLFLVMRKLRELLGFPLLDPLESIYYISNEFQQNKLISLESYCTFQVEKEKKLFVFVMNEENFILVEPKSKDKEKGKEKGKGKENNSSLGRVRVLVPLYHVNAQINLKSPLQLIVTMRSHQAIHGATLLGHPFSGAQLWTFTLNFTTEVYSNLVRDHIQKQGQVLRKKKLEIITNSILSYW